MSHKTHCEDCEDTRLNPRSSLCGQCLLSNRTKTPISKVMNRLIVKPQLSHYPDYYSTGGY